MKIFQKKIAEIGFDEFLALMLKSDSKSDPRAEARAIFDRFDTDHSGSIEASELRQAITVMAPDLPESAVEQLIQVFTPGKLVLLEHLKLLEHPKHSRSRGRAAHHESGFVYEHI